MNTIIDKLKNRISATEGAVSDNTIFTSTDVVSPGSGSRKIKTKSVFKADTLITSIANVTNGSDIITVNNVDLTSDFSVDDKIIVSDTNDNIVMSTITAISFSTDTNITLSRNWLYANNSNAKLYTVDGEVNPQLIIGDIDNNLQSTTIKNESSKSAFEIYGANGNNVGNRILEFRGNNETTLTNVTMKTSNLDVTGNINDVHITSSEISGTDTITAKNSLNVDNIGTSAEIDIKSASGGTSECVTNIKSHSGSGECVFTTKSNNNNGKLLFTNTSYSNLDYVNFETDEFRINGVNAIQIFTPAVYKFESEQSSHTMGGTIVTVEALNTNAYKFEINDCGMWNDVNNRFIFDKIGIFKITWTVDVGTKTDDIRYSHQLKLNNNDIGKEKLQWVNKTTYDDEYGNIITNEEYVNITSTSDYIEFYLSSSVSGSYGSYNSLSFSVEQIQ